MLKKRGRLEKRAKMNGHCDFLSMTKKTKVLRADFFGNSLENIRQVCSMDTTKSAEESLMLLLILVSERIQSIQGLAARFKYLCIYIFHSCFTHAPLS